MTLEYISNNINIGHLSAYEVVPKNTQESNRGCAILLLPMITGINGQVKQWAHDISVENQCTVLVWDNWHGKSTDNTSAEELKALNSAVIDTAALEEQEILLNHLRTQTKNGKIAVIGWCLGGRFALALSAQNPGLAAVVAFHPTLSSSRESAPLNTIEISKNIDAPVFVAYPGKDTIVSPKQFHELQLSLEGRSALTISHIYPQAEHGFSDRRRHSNPENYGAFRICWSQARDFIKILFSSVSPE